MCAVTCAGAPGTLCACPRRCASGAAPCGTHGARGARGASGASGARGVRDTLGPHGCLAHLELRHAWSNSPHRAHWAYTGSQ
eukprot:6848152-Pyramimonas_sp.AAC.1